MNLAIVLLARCNASCTHCSENYGPRRSESLRKEDIFRLMDEAAAIDDGLPLRFDITGGEPFLDFELLTAVIAYGARLGGSLSCVTNAIWAVTAERSLSKLTILRNAGLASLAVSVSRFHQQFVPLDRVRHALSSARTLGMYTELKGAVTKADLEATGSLATWQKTLDADNINIFPVLPQLRQDAVLPDDEYYREDGLPLQKCPGAVVCVGASGKVSSCCAPGFGSSFLTIGDALAMPLADIHRNFRERGKQRILREAGPIRFAVGAIAAGLGTHLRSAYAGPCDLCLHIGTNEELRAVAERMSARFEEDTA